MIANVTQIKSRITINVDVSAKTCENTMCAKNIIFGFVVHVFVKMVII